MKRIDQTILANDPKRQGNCVSACVATLLERPLEEVPHFVEFKIDGDPGDTIAWWSLLIGYMAGHGYWPTQLDTVNDGEPGEILFVMGMSPRGVCHQVLYRDGELWHDPHPSKDGLTDVREVLAWRPVRHDHSPTGPTYGMCTGCGSVEVALVKVTGTRDLSSIGEHPEYPVGYGCELCS